MQNVREALALARIGPLLPRLLGAIVLLLSGLTSAADQPSGRLSVPLSSHNDGITALLLHEVPCAECPALVNRLQQVLADAGADNARLDVLPAVFDDVSMQRARTALVAAHCNLPDKALSAALGESAERTVDARAALLFDFVEPDAAGRCQSQRAVEGVFTDPDVQQVLQRSLAATRVAQPRRLPALILGGLRLDAVDRWPAEALRRQLAAELEVHPSQDSLRTIFRVPDTPPPD